MFEALFTTIISTATSIFTVILPLIVASTGKSALEKDMDLYQKWHDIVSPNLSVANDSETTSGQNDREKSAPQDQVESQIGPVTAEALKEFRGSIDLKLIIHAQNAAKPRFALIVALVILVASYIVCQVALNNDGPADDLLRSLICWALALIIIGVFALESIHRLGIEGRKRHLSLGAIKPFKNTQSKNIATTATRETSWTKAKANTTNSTDATGSKM